jgi:ribonuclease R
MLPEELSADLCSLREGEERACLAVEMIFNAQGVKIRHHFMRGMMRSAAKLEYSQAQRAVDGEPDDKTGPLVEDVLKPLWEAYACVAKARDVREPLDLDAPEFKVRFGPDGKVAAIQRRERLEAHRLIEEFMIQANVAAAETLEEKKTRLVYRVHEQPSKEKLSNLRDFLATLNMKIPHAGALKPEHFNGVLAQAKTLPVADLVNEVVLRSQAQAVYAPDNLGHFGLNLRRYAHFTSPIRRYPDLVVHRAIKAVLESREYKPGGISWSELGVHCSLTERRADDATRDVENWLKCYFMQDKVGESFGGMISGVTSFGIFVTLDELNIDGLVHVTELGRDYFHFDPARHAMVGERSGKSFQLAGRVRVVVARVDLETAKIDFTLADEATAATPARARYSQPLARSAPPSGRGKPRR